MIERYRVVGLDIGFEAHASLPARDQMGAHGRPARGACGRQSLGCCLVCLLRRQDQVSFPDSIAKHCRVRATGVMLSISGARGCVQELAPHYRKLNGDMLWKLTSALQSPWAHASSVHSSQFRQAGSEQIALPAGPALGRYSGSRAGFRRTSSPAMMATANARASGGGRSPRKALWLWARKMLLS